MEWLRFVLAAALLLGYGLLCWHFWRKQRASTAPVVCEPDHSMTLIAYASQTGHAEELARRTADHYQRARLPFRLLSLNQINPADLTGVSCALFIASTCRDGDAPDNARTFLQHYMAHTLALGQLRYALLALGDRAYADFCAFGRRLDHWLQDSGADRLGGRIEMDGADEQAWSTWLHRVAELGQLETSETGNTTKWHHWRIRNRRHLNPGSLGEAAYHLELEPLSGPDADAPCCALPEWEAGDLIQLLSHGPAPHPRNYTIASVPSDGAVHLLVRLQRRSDGQPGQMSGLLCQQAPVGSVLTGKLRRNSNFRIGDNADRALILIGNGTGLAGLMAHLRQRAAHGDGRNWLIFGERSAASDDFYGPELDQLEASGLLARCDRVFSRDGGQCEYVQHRLLKAAETVLTWVHDGAAIYVCGNAVGMAPGVDRALEQILDPPTLADLIQQGRYRRDVY